MRSRSSRDVLWTPPSLGGGNHLYMWMKAWSGQRAGRDSHVLRRPGMDEWIAMFPRLAPLTISEAQVPFLASREVVWFQHAHEFETGILRGFVEDVLAPSGDFSVLVDEAEASQRADGVQLVMNIRRGDYYTNPAFTARYGMDLRRYLDEVIEQVGVEGGARALVISDDVEWAERSVAAWYPQIVVARREKKQGAFGDLAQLVAAPTLVLTNSTFSYWGGYLKTWRDGLLPGDPARGPGRPRVWAPTFHARGLHGGRAYQLLSSWRTVDNAAWEVRDEEATS